MNLAGLGNVLENIGNGVQAGINNYQKPAQPPAFGQTQNKQTTPKPNQFGYTSTQAPFGVDNTNPGVGQQFWNNNQNLWMNSPTMNWANQAPNSNSPKGSNTNTFGGPGSGEQFWNQIAGTFNQKAGPQQQQFDKYWDRATDKAVGSAESAAAARGSYGSSAQLNNVGNVIADMNANRARDQSQFSLQDSANQRAWTQTFGDLAFGANSEGLNNALAMDKAQLDRLMAGYTAATGAEQMRRNQINDTFNHNRAFMNDALNFAGSQYGGIFDSDANLLGAAQNASLGQGANAVATAQNNRNQMRDDLSLGLGFYNAFGNSGG